MAETRTLKVIVVGNAKQASAALRQLSGDADKMGGRVGKSGMKVSSTFAKIGKSAALGFGAATVAAGAFVYKVGAPYEQTLNRIGALNKLNEDQLTSVAKRIEAGASTYAKYNATVGDAAGAVVELNKAGMSLDKSMRAVNATMVLSRAGNLSVEESANLVANTLNTFKMRAGEAGHVANSLANAANASSADLSDMREALAMSALAAKQAGLDIDQTNAYLAILHNNGMKGSDAGTSLKTMFLRLTSGADPVNKALKGIGVSVFDSKGKMRDLNDVVKDFLPALDKLSDEKRAKALYRIFGSDSIRSANAIFGEGSKSIDEMMGKIREAGTAQRFAEAGTKGLSGSVARLKSNFVSLGQVSYRALAPLANKVLAPIADGIGALVPKVMPAAKAMGKLFDGGGSGKGGKALADTFQSLKKFGASLLPDLLKIGKGIGKVVGPAFDDISRIVMDDVLPAFRDFLPAIQPVAKFLLNLFGSALIGVIKGAVDVIKGVLKVITGVLKVFTGLLTGDFGKAWEGVKQIFSGALQAIWGAIQVWWNGSILALFRRIPLALKGLWSKAWNGLKSLAKSGVNALNSILLRILNVVTMPFRKAFAAARGFIGTAWKYIRGDFGKAIGGLRGVLMRIIEVVTYPHRMAFNLVRGIITNGFAMARRAIIGSIKGVKSAMGKVKDGIVKAVKDAGKWLADTGKKIITGLVDAIKSAAKDLIPGAMGFLKDQIKNGLDKLKGGGVPFVPLVRMAGKLDPKLIKGMQEFSILVQKSLGAKLKKKHRPILAQVMEKQEKAVMAAVRRRMRWQAKLDAASKELAKRKAKLAELIDLKNSVVDATRSGVLDHGSLMGTLAGEGERNTVSSILARFAKRLKAIQEFRGNWNKLKDAGLSRGLLSQIASAGVDEGGLMAAALVKATAGQLAQFNSLGSSIDFEAQGFSTEAGAAYNAEIKAAERAVAQQTTVVNNIKVTVQGHVTAEKALAKAIAGEVRAEIKRLDKRNATSSRPRN